MCRSLCEKVIVPDGVRPIAFSVFHYELCQNVRRAIFPKSVEAISGYAIASETVEEVTVHNAEAYISDYAFSWCPLLRAIHCLLLNKTIYLEFKPTRQVCHVEEVTEEWGDEDLSF